MKNNKINIFLFCVTAIIIAVIPFLLLSNYKATIRHPNVMIIVIDALRLDHLGCYGYVRDTSINIDRLAKQGIRFTQAISAAGWTCESVPSILTGTYPPFHHIRGWSDIRNPLAETLAQKLRSKGYNCIFWSNLASLEPMDIKAGFKEFFINPSLNCGELTNKILNQMASDKKSPFFYYIHYTGAHAPYRSPVSYKNLYLNDKYRKKPQHLPISRSCSSADDYKGTGQIPCITAEDNITDPNYYLSQYDSAISYSDAQVGRLIAALKNLSLDQNTVVIVTADHGEMLGEHNVYFTHSDDYEGGFEENIKVPLIIKLPHSSSKGKVFTKPISLIDVAPTILDLVGLKKPAYMQGESLLTFLGPCETYSKEHLLTFYEDAGWVVLRSSRWKLVRNQKFNSWQLYDLKNDLHELNSLVNTVPDSFRRLKLILDNLLNQITVSAAPEKGHELTEGERSRLRSLGYSQ